MIESHTYIASKLEVVWMKRSIGVNIPNYEEVDKLA